MTPVQAAVPSLPVCSRPLATQPIYLPPRGAAVHSQPCHEMHFQCPRLQRGQGESWGGGAGFCQLLTTRLGDPSQRSSRMGWEDRGHPSLLSTAGWLGFASQMIVAELMLPDPQAELNSESLPVLSRQLTKSSWVGGKVPSGPRAAQEGSSQAASAPGSSGWVCLAVCIQVLRRGKNTQHYGFRNPSFSSQSKSRFGGFTASAPKG